MKNDWPTALSFGAIFLVIFTLSQCSQSDKPSLTGDEVTSKIAQFSCPTSPDMVRFQPMQNLDPRNSNKEELVREYIELKRRAIKESWDVAGSVFSIQQFQYATHRNYVDEYKHRAIEAIQQYIKGTFPFEGTLDEHLSGLKTMYDKDCTEQNKTITYLASLDPKLEALREEPSKPWLNPQKRIPCPVMQTPTCRP